MTEKDDHHSISSFFLVVTLDRRQITIIMPALAPKQSKSKGKGKESAKPAANSPATSKKRAFAETAAPASTSALRTADEVDFPRGGKIVAPRGESGKEGGTVSEEKGLFADSDKPKKPKRRKVEQNGKGSSVSKETPKVSDGLRVEHLNYKVSVPYQLGPASLANNETSVRSVSSPPRLFSLRLSLSARSSSLSAYPVNCWGTSL
jgi:hypothetical protein